MSRSKRVLIAEQESQAGRALKAGLEEVGYSVRLAQSGAKALEMAIRARPDLVVASEDLPLIDGCTLFNILRANPNTRKGHFAFLSDAPRTFRPPSGFQGKIFQKPCPVRDLVSKIQDIFQRGERMRKISKSPESMTQGDLGQIPLSDLLQVLQQNRLTGTLFLREPGATRGVGQGFVYLKDGEVINALLGHIESEKALFRLLSWQEGHFELIPDQAVTEWRIRTPLGQLLIESARQADEWKKLRAALPAMGSVLRLRARVASLPPGIHPLTQEVLLLLEYHSRIDEVVDNCSAPDYQVLRTLYTLIRKGIVETVPQGGAGEAQKDSQSSWLVPGQINRLREKLAPHGMPPWGRTHGKVLVFAAHPALRDSLVQAFRGIGGIALPEGSPGRTPAGERGSDPFPVLLEWRLASNICLKLVQAPVDELQRPLWSLLARGAFGGLFLLDGRQGARIDALKPASDFFQSTCPLPIGYLILGEEPVQMELKAKLVSTFTLKGDNALFMLPEGQSGKARSVLKRFLDQMINH
jgi:CheY-like chemotaxis protein